MTTTKCKPCPACHRVDGIKCWQKDGVHDRIARVGCKCGFSGPWRHMDHRADPPYLQAIRAYNRLAAIFDAGEVMIKELRS